MTIMRWAAIVLLTCCHCAPWCEAGQRIGMTGPPEEEEIARNLIEEMVACYNRKQFQAFMAHFTPARAAAIRKMMEHVFIIKDIEIEVIAIVVLSRSDDQLVFGLRYEWAERGHPKRLICSRITAQQSAKGWQVEAEEVLSGTDGLAESPKSSPSYRVNFGGGGVVVLNPADDLSPRDIAKSTRGCAGGRCGVPR